MRLDGLDRLPTPREVEVRGVRWRPYASLAALYLWRILDGPAVAP
jgi:DNA-3-methyladenine glycosylase II